nr:reverse transcriptase domain-containing protein [Tanacetum cinerariifolium]
NTITYLKEDLKGITTRSGTTYQGPTIPTTSSSLPLVVERETEPVVAPIIEPVIASISGLKPNQKPSIPYPSRLPDKKLRDKANDQKEKFFQIFQDLNFNISFADDLILMPQFGPTIKTLLTNKDKLSELARTPLNEHCLAVLLKKLPEKLGDPDKMDECLALADLSASINIMPLLVWNKLLLPELSPTCMTLELADRSISRPVRVAEDVFVKVGTFHFPADFVVIDFDADPRAITFNLDQTLRYSASYNDMTANRIDLIDMAYPIVSTTSSSLTPFGDSDFLLEEVEAFLDLEDDPISPEVDQSYLDTEGDILLLEAFLNDDPSLLPPNQGNYLPQVRKELEICEAKTNKSSIDEPPEEKTALITVLKSHKRAIAWKLSHIKGINSEFCTRKILMEDEFESVVQHHRRVNPKIYDVIKKDVLKLLDAGLIYPIFESPWVSPVHCVPKKGGFTVVKNEENELIPTRLVTGWRVCIDYRKLNEATRKDHFPLPFMDQMLERLAGSKYYCFLDGFSVTFKFPSIQKIKKRPHSRVLTERLPTVACLLGYAMHRACSKGV